MIVKVKLIVNNLRYNFSTKITITKYTHYSPEINVISK